MTKLDERGATAEGLERNKQCNGNESAQYRLQNWLDFGFFPRRVIAQDVVPPMPGPWSPKKSQLPSRTAPNTAK